MPPQGATFIARRRYVFSKGAKSTSIAIEIGVPKRLRGGEWACPYRIRGLGDGRIHRARGVDGVQALILAIEGARLKLGELGDGISWGGEQGSAIPRYVPDYFGAELSSRIDKMIDRELVRFARVAERKRRA